MSSRSPMPPFTMTCFEASVPTSCSTAMARRRRSGARSSIATGTRPHLRPGSAARGGHRARTDHRRVPASHRTHRHPPRSRPRLRLRLRLCPRPCRRTPAVLSPSVATVARLGTSGTAPDPERSRPGAADGPPGAGERSREMPGSAPAVPRRVVVDSAGRPNLGPCAPGPGQGRHSQHPAAAERRHAPAAPPEARAAREPPGTRGGHRVRVARGGRTRPGAEAAGRRVNTSTAQGRGGRRGYQCPHGEIVEISDDRPGNPRGSACCRPVHGSPQLRSRSRARRRRPTCTRCGSSVVDEPRRPRTPDARRGSDS